MYVMYADDNDPAMRYEGLARTAFDCGRWGGPGGIANQGFYNNFVPDLNLEAIIALKKIVSALISKVTGGRQEDLKQVLKSLNEEMVQESGIALIDYVIGICQEEP